MFGSQTTYVLVLMQLVRGLNVLYGIYNFTIFMNIGKLVFFTPLKNRNLTCFAFFKENVNPIDPEDSPKKSLKTFMVHLNTIQVCNVLESVKVNNQWLSG